jgi:hypothetical protein
VRRSERLELELSYLSHLFLCRSVAVYGATIVPQVCPCGPLRGQALFGAYAAAFPQSLGDLERTGAETYVIKIHEKDEFDTAYRF